MDSTAQPNPSDFDSADKPKTPSPIQTGQFIVSSQNGSPNLKNPTSPQVSANNHQTPVPAEKSVNEVVDNPDSLLQNIAIQTDTLAKEQGKNLTKTPITSEPAKPKSLGQENNQELPPLNLVPQDDKKPNTKSQSPPPPQSPEPPPLSSKLLGAENPNIPKSQPLEAKDENPPTAPSGPDPSPYSPPNTMAATDSESSNGSIFDKLKIVLIILGVIVLLGIIGSAVYFFVLPSQQTEENTVGDGGALIEDVLPPIPKRTQGGFADIESPSSFESTIESQLEEPQPSPDIFEDLPLSNQ